jgi:hypothetical protein
MNYELCKELEEAGFPQGDSGQWVFPPDKLVSRYYDRVYVPTLEQLIEACGDFEFKLLHASAGWCAETRGEVSLDHPTPSEAVARLWLAVHKKGMTADPLLSSH